MTTKSGYRLTETLRHSRGVLLEHIINTEKDTLRFRLLALVIAAASLYSWVEWGDDATEVSMVPAVTIAVAYLIYTLLLGRTILPWITPMLASGRTSTALVFGMSLVDAATLGALLYLVGGPQSVALILIPLFVIYHSIYLGYVSGLFSATIFSLFYVGFAYPWGEAALVTSYIGWQVPLFYLLALFGSYLSERRLKDWVEKEELQRLLLLKAEETPLADETASGGPSLDSIFQEVIGSSSRLTELPGCLLTLLDEEGQKLIGRVGNVNPMELNLNSLDELSFDAAGSAVTALALRTGQPVVIADAIRDEHKLPTWAQWLGVGALLVVPLVAGGQNWGAMFLFDLSPGHGITREKVNLAKGYAQMAARAIADARLRGTSS